MKPTNLSTAKRATGQAPFSSSVRFAVAPERASTKALSAPSVEEEANFDHWWNDEAHRNLSNGGESLESAKVAATYEGARRRPEVRAAFLAQLIPPAWQHFTGLVVAWFSSNWSQLFPDQQKRLFCAFHDPLYVPPAGMSTFPQRNPELASELAALPMESARPDFCDYAGRLESAGYRIFAVDCKSRAAIVAACKRILRSEKTVRASDVRTELSAVVLDHPNGHSFRVEGKSLRLSTRFHFYRLCSELAEADRKNIPSEFIESITL